MSEDNAAPEKRQDRRRMSDEDVGRIAQAISAALFTDEHTSHHAYIAELIEARRIRRERWENIRRQVMGWTIIAALSAIGTAAYKVGAYLLQSGRSH